MAEDSRIDRTDLLDFYLAERSGLRRYFMERLGPVAEVDDLAQEAWMRLDRNSVQAQKAPGPYLKRIAASLVIDFARKHRRVQTATLDATLPIVDASPTPEETAIWQSEVMALRAALHELPRRRRDIFILVSLQGQPRKDVARRYGVSRRTVESELRMALDHCADRLKMLR